IRRLLLVNDARDLASDVGFAFVEDALDCQILSHESNRGEVDLVINLELGRREGIVFHEKVECLGCFRNKVFRSLLVHSASEIETWYTAALLAVSVDLLSVSIVTLCLPPLHVIGVTQGVLASAGPLRASLKIRPDINYFRACFARLAYPLP